ncbi:GANC glucosidase, partial [Atractosteus spatula]|nr:GANC glucosidase [Atractosteus spatula]
ACGITKYKQASKCLKLSLFYFCSITTTIPVDEGKEMFKKCNDIAFYRRQKELQHGSSHYRALMDTLVLSERGAQLELVHTDTEVPLLLQVCAIQTGIVRVKINELQPIRPRYEVPDVLIHEPVTQQLTLEQVDADSLTLRWEETQSQVRIALYPFRLEVLCKGEVTATLNSEGRLCFEPLKDPPQRRRKKKHLERTFKFHVFEMHSFFQCTKKILYKIPQSVALQKSLGLEDDTSGLWKEKFRQFVDIKANGPSSVGLDFRLHGFSNVYGIPEHADTHRLQDTSAGEPYRLYNLDVFAYKIHSRLGLYGSVPLLLAHKPERTIGVFWLNASETLLHVDTGADHLVKRRRQAVHTDLHWMSESGIIDTFLLLGPTPFQVFAQYAELTGMSVLCYAGWQALPPLFSLGYHQCRWTYRDEADVKAVDQGFDQHEIPYDVIWLDIEHTEGKRYFTWDSKLFPDPVGLQDHLQVKNRKLVVISDPHVKIDPDYSVYSEAKDLGHFVKSRDGNPYQGSCWPGPCCYLDFSSPKARAWYATMFFLHKYKGSTEALFVWNDMNEPSVFGGPEQTMPKDAVHCGGWEHRELHNLYGFYQHWATAEGLIVRSEGTVRPFVLSRSFFAGSQRFGAVWTGDNVASWDYLKISIPMLLTLSITGIAFCGADVGGFTQDPDPELLVRWYQAGALQPFFRGHSDCQARRREPWLFGEEVTSIVRRAICERYCLLPYWYSLFRQAHVSARPPLRPLWVEFPQDHQTFAVEAQYMIGNALLACPVTDPGVTEIKVLLPGSGECWYDTHTFQRFGGGRTVRIPVTLDTVPLFQRGGTVVPRKAGAGKCTADQWLLPFTLTVALDTKGCAEGELYVDDGHSFNYKSKKEFALRKFTFLHGTLSSSCADNTGTFDLESTVESVRLVGIRKKPTAVTAQVSGGSEDSVAFAYEETTSLLTVEGLRLPVVQDWLVQIK